MKYHNLTILKETHRNKYSAIYVLAKCDCGIEKIMRLAAIKSGNSRSCGVCDTFKQKRAGIGSIHGHKVNSKESKEYGIWRGMKQRCSNPKNASYIYYGGCGIKVCDRWQLFENFIADMGKCPSNYSIERIDPNGNYELTNCKWIPLSDQRYNRSDYAV